MNHCMIATNNFNEEPSEVEVEADDTESALQDSKEPLEDLPKTFVVEFQVKFVTLP